MAKKVFKRYLTINPYNDTFALVEKNRIKRLGSAKYYKNAFAISYLQTKDLILSEIEINKNILPQDMQDAIEIKAYEELDLDPSKEYIIKYVELPLPVTSKNKKVQLFITEKEKVTTVFEHIIKSVKYIDAITPIPLLFKPLYEKNLLSSLETHLFIYMQNDDVMLSLYKEGDFIYAKSLKYSFTYIADVLSKKAGEEISVEEITKMLEKEGVVLSDLDKQQEIMKIFSEMFMQINDIIIFAKRAYEIENINKIFISSDIGHIKGIEVYAQTYLATEAYDFSFDYSFENSDRHIEDIHYLLAFCAKEIVEDELELPNLTIFPHPPPLFQRPSGELIVVTVLATALALSFPLYNVVLYYKYKWDVYTLQKEYKTIHHKKIALESKINTLRATIERINKLLKKNQEALRRREKVLQSIYDKKVHYTMKGVTLADLTQDIVRYKIKILSLQDTNKNIDFNITAIDNKNITKLIRYITQNKAEKYDITTPGIEKMESNKTRVYFSTIKVKVK